MAKLTQMPQQKIVLGFKGVIDFYTWKGIPVARKWPYLPKSRMSPRSLAQNADFAFIAGSYREAEASVVLPLRHMAEGTQSTSRDLFVTLAYGHGIELSGTTWPNPPHPDEPGADMLQIDVATSPTNANQLLSPASLTYVALPNLTFNVDFSVTSYTHFMLEIVGLTTQSGQQITAQLARASNPATPLTSVGNDLQMPSTFGNYSTPWLPFAGPMPSPEELVIALKGSASGTTLSHRGIRLTLKYAP